MFGVDSNSPLVGVLLLCASAVPCASASDGSDPGRPWRIEGSLVERYRESARAAGDDAAARLAALEFALTSGLFEAALTDGKELLADPATAARARELLGLVERDGASVPAEASRFSAERPDLSRFRLAPLPNVARQAALKGRFRDVRLANKSTYFDLWTDLTDDELVHWTQLLNGYYRDLKNRFRAWRPGTINVLIFDNRSDYLRYYAGRFRTYGEHVLGFYEPGRRMLTFHADAADLEEVENVARHECTHLLVDLSYGGAPLPAWFHEGLACHLAGDGVNVRGRYTASLIEVVTREAMSGEGPRVGAVLDVKKDTLAFVHYAWSWALVQFLSSGRHEAAFQKFMVDLREAVDGETSVEDAQKRARELLLASIGLEEQDLDTRLRDHFKEEFALTRADQLVDLGEVALEEARHEEKAAGRRTKIELATSCFQAAGAMAGADATTDARRRFGLLACQVARAGLDDVGIDETRLVLRALVDGLPSLEGLADGTRKAALAREGLRLAAAATGVRRDGGEATDLRAAMTRGEGRWLKSQTAARQAVVVLADDLTAVALEALGRSLAADPLDPRALHERVFLGVEAVPALLEDVFEPLRLLVEVDPSDLNLAALGAVYVGLGREEWGRFMVRAAKDRSAGPSAVEPWVQLVGR